MIIALIVVQNGCTKVVLDTQSSHAMLDAKSAKSLGLQVMWDKIKGKLCHYKRASGI